eukprot:Nitzschia sp. Nitz4//scaffold2_size372955//239346//240126//NITZ4_000445-RA/size372955-snap-gene-0.94-mRNA-1//-1//CDS//3329546844//3244//frame0
MASFGELVLVLGDLHIPGRASAIPEQFKRMLVPNKMKHTICTGNIGVEQYNELLALSPNVHVVAGNHDDPSLSFPETQVVQVGQFRLGIVHGHQILPYQSQEALVRWRRKLGVDILITGNTHQNDVYMQDGFYHINPGSITGAFSPLVENVTPSFVLLAIQATKLVCYVYELANGEVEVSKTEFTKSSTPDGAAPALMQSLLA